jgi:uncharacterized protein
MVQARRVLDSIALGTLSTEVCERAAVLDPGLLRSLDALHLSAALDLGDELEAVVAYDRLMAEGARGLGIGVPAPT